MNPNLRPLFCLHIQHTTHCLFERRRLIGSPKVAGCLFCLSIPLHRADNDLDISLNINYCVLLPLPCGSVVVSNLQGISTWTLYSIHEEKLFSFYGSWSMFSDISYQMRARPCGVVANMLNCNISATKFKLQLLIYFHFQSNILGEKYQTVMSPAMDSIAPSTRMGFALKKPAKVDMPYIIKKRSKTKTLIR